MRLFGPSTRFAVVPLALSLMLTACAPPPQSPAAQNLTPDTDTPATTPVPSRLLGKGFLDKPIVGATLTVRDTSGQVLLETADATDANGYFSLPMPETLPKDFRVEISGGTRDGVASTLVLKADARSYDPLIDRLYLNAATTLAAVRLDMIPSGSLAQTQTAVARYLNLPDGVALGIDLDNPTLNAFSHAKFMDVVDAQGGFPNLIQSMAWELAGGVTTTYDFSNPLLQSGGAIAKTIALEIGKGALGKVGGSLAGWGLDAIFGGGDDGSQQRHEEVLAQFAEQRRLFRQLDNKIGELQTSVNGIKSAIASLEISMNKQFGLAAYNTKVDVLLTPIGTIDGLFDAYMDEISRLDGSAAGKARVTALVNDIQSRVPTALTTLHLAMTGTAGGDGAIAQWHRLVGHNNRAGENGGNRYPYLVNSEFIGQLNDQLEYFEGVQLRGITLLVEARNFRQDSVGAKSDHDRFMGYLDAQKQAIYSLRLESDDVLISPYQGVMWDKTPLANDSRYTFDLEVGALPSTIKPNLAALTTAGHADWRMPTDLDLYYLGAPTNGRHSTNRQRTALKAAGFNLALVDGETPSWLISSSQYGSVYAGILEASGVMEFVRNPAKGVVLPARTFKKDPLATL